MRPNRRVLCRSASDGEPIHNQQDDRPEQGHEEARWLVRSVQSQSPSDPTTEERTHDPQNDRDEDSARIFAGHNELRNRTDNEPEDNPAKKTKHSRIPPEPRLVAICRP